MPIGISFVEYSKVEKSTQTMNKREVGLICVARFVSAAEDYTRSRQVILQKAHNSFSKTSCEIQGEFTCYENIGMEIPFDIEESAQIE